MTVLAVYVHLLMGAILSSLYGCAQTLSIQSSCPPIRKDLICCPVIVTVPVLPCEATVGDGSQHQRTTTSGPISISAPASSAAAVSFSRSEVGAGSRLSESRRR